MKLSLPLLAGLAQAQDVYKSERNSLKAILSLKRPERKLY
jgi:hypothetical protein